MSNLQVAHVSSYTCTVSKNGCKMRTDLLFWASWNMNLFLINHYRGTSVRRNSLLFYGKPKEVQIDLKEVCMCVYVYSIICARVLHGMMVRMLTFQAGNLSTLQKKTKWADAFLTDGGVGEELRSVCALHNSQSQKQRWCEVTWAATSSVQEGGPEVVRDIRTVMTYSFLKYLM